MSEGTPAEREGIISASPNQFLHCRLSPCQGFLSATELSWKESDSSKALCCPRKGGSIQIYFKDLKGKAMHLLNEPLTSASNNLIINNDWVVKQESAAKNISIVLVKLTLACNVFERSPSY